MRAGLGLEGGSTNFLPGDCLKQASKEVEVEKKGWKCFLVRQALDTGEVLA